MLYIDSLTLHNFKSFKYAKIKFGKGFSCIVGPNGSGKSCIGDAVFFALGETSLRRMRVKSLSSLINDSVKLKNDKESHVARVKLVFSGDENIEVSKAVKHGNKVSYRLNGKRVTRQEVIEALRHHGSEIDETNTVAQGEITKMLELTPKERRELIDSAAGIKEFNEKKAAALKELEKVEQKVNEALLVLNTQFGFLKDLEKDKKEAEKYTVLKERIAKVNYIILKSREKTLTIEYENAINSTKDNEREKTKKSLDIEKLDGNTATLLSEKSKLLKEMDKGSSGIGSMRKELEEANREIAVNDSRITSIDENLGKILEKIDELKTEKERILAERKSNVEKLNSASKELEEKSAALEKISGSADEKLRIYEETTAEIENKTLELNVGQGFGHSKLNCPLPFFAASCSSLCSK